MSPEPATDGAARTPDRSWHGPASVAGAVTGSVVTVVMALVLAAPPDAVHLLLPWALGLPLLLAPGVVRRFGVGLVASALALPTLPAAVALVSTLG